MPDIREVHNGAPRSAGLAGKSRGGKPKRDRVFHVRLTENEYTLLLQRTPVGKKPAQYVRDQIFGKRAATTGSKMTPDQAKRWQALIAFRLELRRTGRLDPTTERIIKELMTKLAAEIA